MKRQARFFLSLLLLGLAAGAAHGECPLNEGRIGLLQQCAFPQSTAPVFSMTASNCFGGFGSVSYDLIAGTLEVSSFSQGHEGFQSWMQVSDDYVIEGPPSATPIGISVICTVNMQPRSELQLSSGATSVSTVSFGPTVQTLRLYLEKQPGEHFSVGMRATVFPRWEGTPQQSTIRGALQFSVLPPGYTLTSCQGYAALPVAARYSTWGQVKRIYR
jgi:hypothetical protein